MSHFELCLRKQLKLKSVSDCGGWERSAFDSPYIYICNSRCCRRDRESSASAGYLTNAAATEAQLAPQIVSKSPNQENTFFHHNSDPLLTERHDSSYSTDCLWKSS